LTVFREQNSRDDKLVGLGRQGEDLWWTEEALVVGIDVDPFVFPSRCQNMFSVGTEIQAIERLWDRCAGYLVKRLRLDRDDLVFTVSAVKDSKLVARGTCQHVNGEITKARLLALGIDGPAVGQEDITGGLESRKSC